MKRWWIAVVALGLLAWAAAEWSGPAQGDAAPADSPWLWVYAPVNFQVDQEGDRLVELIRRAGKAGYNAVVVTDTKFGRMGDRPKNYYDNLRRAVKAAEEAGVEIIPMTTSFGYSNDLLQNDPNLAEGIAVRDCPFVVHDGKAVPADDANMLPMGDFETFKGDAPAGWDYVDGPGKSTFPDEEVKHGGRRSLRLENFKAGNEGGNARAMKKVAVQPWRQYHISLWLRTRDVEPVGDLHVAVLAPDGHELNYAFLGVQATEDWTQHHVVFNSLDNESVTVSVGLWGGRKGTFWMDDIDMRPVGGVNLPAPRGLPRARDQRGRRHRVHGGQGLQALGRSAHGRGPVARRLRRLPRRLAAGPRRRLAYSRGRPPQGFLLPHPDHLRRGRRLLSDG